MLPHTPAKFVVIKSLDAPYSPGFMVRNVRAFPTLNAKGERTYQVLGYANTVNEAAAVIFPNLASK
jgi:hypothetical protein